MPTEGPTIEVTGDRKTVWVYVGDSTGLCDCYGARFCRLSGEIFFRRADMSTSTVRNESWTSWKRRVEKQLDISIEASMEPNWSKERRESEIAEEGAFLASAYKEQEAERRIQK